MSKETLQELLERTFGPAPQTPSRLPQETFPKEDSSKTLIRALLLGLVVVLGVVTAVLLNQTNSLSRKNEALLAESARLQGTVERLLHVEKDNQTLRTTLESVKKENESVRTDLQKTQDHLKALTDEKSTLQKLLDRRTQEVDAMKKGPAGAALKLREKEEVVRKLGEENKILSKRLERLYKTVNDKIASISVAKLALEETIADARKKIDEEWSTVDLGSIAVGTGGSPPGRRNEANRAVKKEGRVLAVNEDHGFVIIDLGRVDGIKNNAVFSLVKDGQPVATLTVLEIRDVMTACNIKDLAPGARIAVNDPVSIKK